MRKIVWILAALLVVAAASNAQMKRSTKRGLCENDPNYTVAYVDSLKAGVAWTYNWAVRPTPQPSNLQGGEGMTFAPMCWNGDYDSVALLNYLDNHPETRYLLGFNEPNFSSQANMTPAQAAAIWPRLESIAARYHLRLVSPALNFTGEQVGGKVWGIDTWLGSFIDEYRAANGNRDPRMDCIALHCYMNWSAALDWYVNTYLYASDRDASLRAYFERNGKKPIMLTEWCAWEGDKDGFTTNVDNQIDQMVQKVQVMELSPNVEGYAWFMGIGGNINNSYPYWHVFQNGANGRELTELGRVYTHMSSFDSTCYWPVNQVIFAKDYMYMYEGQLRHNTDSESSAPIELSKFQQYVNWENKTITPYVDYQVELPSTGDYQVLFRLNAPAGATFQLQQDGNQVAERTFAAFDGWTTDTLQVALTQGRHTLRVLNVNQGACKFNWLKLQAATSGVETVTISAGKTVQRVVYYNMKGEQVGAEAERPLIRLTTYTDGSQSSEKIY